MIKLTDNTGVFKGKSYLVGSEQSQAIDAIADAIAFQKPKIVMLLQKYDIPVPEKATSKELLTALLFGFDKHKEMKEDFASSLFNKSHFSNATDSPLFDEDGHPLTEGGVRAGSADDPNACSWWARNFGNCSTYPSGSGNTANNASNILSGVAGIINLFNNPDTTVLSQQTNAQILALAAEKEAARKRNNIIAIIVVVLLIGGVSFGLYKYVKNKKKND